MGRPLWRELRQRRPDGAAPPPIRLHFGRAILAAAGAAIAFGLGRSSGNIRSKHTTPELYALACAAALVVFGLYAVRRVANQVSGALAAQGGRGAASAVRLTVTLVGAVIVALLTLAMLRIDVSQLLLGGAITGVVLGIAAQQSLGNLFAGIVLLVARPFTVGSRIRVRSGTLGGIFEGEVTSMGMTYVTFETEEGVIWVPNLTLLAAGIVRLPPAAQQAGAALVVSRGLSKRPPRAGAPTHQLRRTPKVARRQREMIRRIRARRLLNATGDKAPGSADGGPQSVPKPAQPGTGPPETPGPEAEP